MTPRAAASRLHARRARSVEQGRRRWRPAILPKPLPKKGVKPVAPNVGVAKALPKTKTAEPSKVYYSRKKVEVQRSST